jgi:hypothetical protein
VQDTKKITVFCTEVSNDFSIKVLTISLWDCTHGRIYTEQSSKSQDGPMGMNESTNILKPWRLGAARREKYLL